MIKFELYDPDEYPVCGKPRAKGGKVTCEYPAGHLRDEGHYYNHIGRDVLGRWHSWRTSKP